MQLINTERNQIPLERVEGVMILVAYKAFWSSQKATHQCSSKQRKLNRVNKKLTIMQPFSKPLNSHKKDQIKLRFPAGSVFNWQKQNNLTQQLKNSPFLSEWKAQH